MYNFVKFKGKFLKSIAIFLCFALVLPFSLIPTVSAAENTSVDFAARLDEVKKLYPHGSVKYEWSVNGSVVGWQCHGYARWISSYVWGTDFANGSGKGWERYDSTATTTAIERLAPGDVLRYRTAANKSSNHSIFVTSIEGDIVYFTDCNSDGNSTIKWNRSVTKEYLAEHLKMQLAGRDQVEYGYIAHYTANTMAASNSVSISFNANGGEIADSGETVTEYTVLDSTGLNLRSGAGTEYPTVSAMPMGTVFTVTETALDKAGKYTWGKTVYNGKVGWCVISMHWTSANTFSVTPYYTDSSGNIMISNGNAEYVQTMLSGNEYKDGFAKAELFGLKKDGYTFLGWARAVDGEVIAEPSASVIPENVFPELEDGNFEITLYAVWQSDVYLSSIEIAEPPVKTKYLLNAPFDSSGLKIKLNYSNNTSEIISSGFILSGFDSTTAGEKTVTVTYLDKTVDLKILVPDIKTGNLNGDYEIDLLDVSLLAQYVAGWDTDINKSALDVNGDGFTDLVDVVQLARYVAGWDGVEIK